MSNVFKEINVIFEFWYKIPFLGYWWKNCWKRVIWDRYIWLRSNRCWRSRYFCKFSNFQKVVLKMILLPLKKNNQNQTLIQFGWMLPWSFKNITLKDQKNTRISKKTYYRLDIMQSYSTNFVMAIIAAVSYSSNHLANSIAWFWCWNDRTKIT